MENLKSILNEEFKTTSSELRKTVISDIIDKDDVDYMSGYVLDVVRGGISGGCVSGLIYYSDTTDFFDEHYEEIADLVDDYQDETDSALKINGDMKNFYAWFAYEQVMNDLYHMVSEYIED